MSKFLSLAPEGLPKGYDAKAHSTKPIVSIEKQAEGQIVVKYIFPGFDVLEECYEVGKKDPERLSFVQINIEDAGSLAEEGKPLLPMLGRYVQIPFNSDYRIQVDIGQKLEFDEMRVLPAQGRFLDTTDTLEYEHALWACKRIAPPPEGGEAELTNSQVFIYDKKWYDSGEGDYPSEMVSVTGPFEVDGSNSLLVRVRPLQYNPSQRKLVGSGNIAVTIQVSPKEEARSHLPRVQAFSKGAFRNLFFNPEANIEAQLGVQVPKLELAPAGEKTDYEFLIIYHDDFRDAADALAKWKNRRGLRTQTVSIQTVGNSVQAIKEYVRQRAGVASDLRYVLLLGDVDYIATETIEGGPHGGNATDFYYSTLNDPDGSQELILPKLAIGRVPVQKAEEAMAVVERLIHYEQDPPADPEYYKKITLIALFEDYDQDGQDERAFVKTMQSIFEKLKALNLNVRRVFMRDSDCDPTMHVDGTSVSGTPFSQLEHATRLTREAVKEGRLIIAYRGHGTRIGWSRPKLRTFEVDTIDSVNPSVYFSISCCTGEFDSERDSLAEKLLKKGCASSLIASTRPSQTWLNNDLTKAIFDAIWPGAIPTWPSRIGTPMRYHRLGDILNYGKYYLPLKKEEHEATKDQLEIYHVIGDPTLELWTAKPQVINLKAGLAGGKLVISMAPICPEDSVITVWRDHVCLKRIEPSSSSLTISLEDSTLPASPATISVCFWAPGYRFWQQDLAL
jgi:hypothetical protein